MRADSAYGIKVLREAGHLIHVINTHASSVSMVYRVRADAPR